MPHWSQELETGDARIDAEHREIYDRLNEIGAAIDRGSDPEALTRLITLLLDYAYLHFHHEEHAMACARCPFHERNCTAHRLFIERVKTWLVIVNSGTAPISLISDIYREGCTWIEHHIATVDSGLRTRTAEPVCT